MFCKYCGNQVPDGYVCNCPDAAAARAAAAAPVATAAPQAAPAPAAAPAAGNDIGKVIGNAFQSTPAAIKTLLTNTEGAGVGLPATVVLAIGGLLLNILAWVLMVAGIMGGLKDSMGIAGDAVWKMVEKVFKGIYGYGILGGLWTCIIPIALSMAIIIIGQLIRKEQVNIVSAFTTGTCVNVVPSAIFLVGALITLVIPVIGIILILVGIVAGLAADYKLLNKTIANTNGLVGGLIAAAVVAVVAGLMAWIVYGVIAGYVEGPLADNMATVMGGAIGDIDELLGRLLGGGF